MTFEMTCTSDRRMPAWREFELANGPRVANVQHSLARRSIPGHQTLVRWSCERDLLDRRLIGMRHSGLTSKGQMTDDS